MFKQLHYFKSWLLLMLCIFVGGVGSAFAEDTEAVTFSEQYSDKDKPTSYEGTNFTLDFASNGGTAVQYYATGSSLRLYAKNTMTVSSSKTITKIELSFGTGDGSNDITTSEDTYENGTWEGSANEVIFTIGGTKGHRRIASVTVTFDSSTPSSPLASISVEGAESTFHVGDEFTHAQAVVTATYEDESTAEVTANATFSTPDMTTVGTKEVTVSYTEGEVERTATYEIEVLAPATLESIELSGTWPMEFTQGDEFSHEGLMVTAWYDDGTSEDVTADAGFTGFPIDSDGKLNEAGVFTVTVDYEGKIETYDITVNEYVMPSVLTIDFENALSTYNEWTFDNIGTTNTAILAHGGDKYGANINANGNGVATATIQTKSKIANPGTLTCYVSKTSGNTKTSEWDIQVSSDGETWTTVETKDATTMSAGTWDEVTADLSSYTNVYVRVYYEGSTAIRTIDDISLTMAQPKVLSSITLSGDYPTTFHVGDAFSHEGMTVTANYDDDSTKDVTEDATFSAPDMTTAGEKTVTVSYTENEVEKTTTYNITVNAPATLESITLSGEYPTEFEQGDAFSSEGIVVTANWSDQTTTNVTSEATFTGYNMSTVGEQTVTVTYGEQTATYTINVAVKKGTLENPYTVADALAAQPANDVYVQGTISAITEVSTQFKNATYTISDGTNEMLIYRGRYLDNADFTSADQIQIGDVVKVYGNIAVYNSVNQMAQGNYIVSQTQKELSSITLSGTYATSFVEGSEFNHDGVVVTATYSDQTTADVTELATFTEPDMTQVGDQDVTVSYGNQTASYTITITALPTHTATFSVNGTTSTEDFKEGAAIDFPVVADQIGMKCVGWVTSEISGTTDVKPSLVTSATMGSEDITYYAVFAFVDDSGETTYEKLESDEFEAGATYLLAGPQSASVATLWYLSSYSAVDTNLGWGEASTALADAKTFTLSGTAGELYAQDNDGNYLKFGVTGKFTMSSTATAIELDEAGNIKSGENFLRHNYNNGGGGFRWYNKETSQPANFYKVISGTTYSDYCTTIPTTVAITITAAGAASFSSKYALDFSKVSELTAYKATSKSDSYVHLDEVEQVPAGAGVIVKGAEGTYNVPVVTGDVAELEGNLLQGTATKAYTVGDDYGKVFKYVKRTSDGVVGFQKAKADWTCQVGHAYLMLPTPSAREYLNIFDEEPIDDVATGINSIDNGQLTIDNDAPAYNLAGQKVGKGYKGIVVKNGKKYVK